MLLLTWRFQHYAHAPSVLVPIARASAAGIYFNFALVLLPLLRFLFSRRSLSFLRAVFPLHQALEAHAIAGVAVLGFSVVHTLAYIGLTFTHPALVASFGGVALATGVLLVLLLGALAWGAWQRTRGRYDAFYYTHFLTIPIATRWPSNSSTPSRSAMPRHSRMTPIAGSVLARGISGRGAISAMTAATSAMPCTVLTPGVAVSPSMRGRTRCSKRSNVRIARSSVCCTVSLGNA